MNKLSAVAVLLLSLAIAGCKKGDNVIKKGSTVKINYTLTVDNQVVDSSTGGEPLTYVQGSGQIIPGLEEQLEGMKPTEKKHVTVSPEKGYGAQDPKAFHKVPRKAFQDGQKLKVGDIVSGDAGGQKFQAKIAGVDKEEITLDLNHPLAGKTLNFEVEVVDVQAGS